MEYCKGLKCFLSRAGQKLEVSPQEGGSGGNFLSPKQDKAALSSVPARSALGWVPQQALVQQSALLPRMNRDVKVSPGILEPVASGA